jgi:DNA-binding LacI/PurR family transcriptional regulator
MEEHAYTLGYKILFSNTGGVVEKEENQIKHYREIGVHGLAIATADHAYEVSPTIKHLLQDSFPFVMISYVDDPEIPFVGTDNEAGAYMATEFLIHKGYKRVGYMNGEIGNLVGDIRLRGYLKAMNNHKRSVLPGDVVRLPLKGAWNDYQSGYQIGEQFAKRSDRPDALFCYNDLSAIGFMEAIMKHGVRVPEDVAIVGFDDVERASFAAVPLTTIHQPTAEIGRIAMETLMDKIDGKPTINRVILPPKLIIRSSS